MRADLQRRLGALEQHLRLSADTLPAVVYDRPDDGRLRFIWAGWQNNGECKTWNRSSGIEIPSDLKYLIRRFDLPRPSV